MSLSSPSPSRARVRLPAPLVGQLVLVVLFVLLLALRGELGNFFSLDNQLALMHQSVVPALCALGVLLIIITGGIDLSVGSVIALVTVITMQVYRLVDQGFAEVLPADQVAYLENWGWNWQGTGSAWWSSLAAIPAGILVGGLAGFVNGSVITRLKVAPFVATLGMFSVARGLAIWLAGRKLVSFSGPRPEWVDTLSRTPSGSDLFDPEVVWSVQLLFESLFDPGVWSVVLLALLTWVLLRYTVLGRYAYAIGSNEATARLCGIRVEQNKLLLYTLAGFLFGWAGVVRFAQSSTGDPHAAEGLELDVIAAVVIGGASLAGGQGTVPGTLLGVLILNMLAYGTSFFKVPVEVKYILIGVIVVANTALSRWQRQRGG